MKSMRPTLYGSRHAVSAGHYLAAAAGLAILEAGGNAIDAGCAAGIALGVLHPDEVNVAGVAPIMIRTGQGKVVTIAGLGHWPKGFPADLVKVARRKLRYLNAADDLGDLRSPPGNRLEALAGDRKGQHSIRINDQFRVCFVWTAEGPGDVEIVDYH